MKNFFKQLFHRRELFIEATRIDNGTVDLKITDQDGEIYREYTISTGHKLPL